MSKKDYHRMLYEAKQDLAHDLVQRQKLDARIARRQALVSDLQNLCAEDDRKSFENRVERFIKKDLKVGITESTRIILQENFFPMTAIDLKKQIEARKLNIHRYANPLAVIHTVLKRLIEGGEVRAVSPINGLKAYQWISSTEKALSELQKSNESNPEKHRNLKEPK
jgi:hypothetical protein